MHQCILGLSCISMKDDNAGLILSYQIFIHISQLSTFCSQKKIAALSCDCCLLSPYVIWNYFFRPRFCEFLNGKNISILFFQMLVVCIFIIFFFLASCLVWLIINLSNVLRNTTPLWLFLKAKYLIAIHGISPDGWLNKLHGICQ